MQKSNRKPLYSAISVALTSSVMTAAMYVPAYADDDSVELEEVIVTATKQARSLQDDVCHMESPRGCARPFYRLQAACSRRLCGILQA